MRTTEMLRGLPGHTRRVKEPGTEGSALGQIALYVSRQAASPRHYLVEQVLQAGAFGLLQDERWME